MRYLVPQLLRIVGDERKMGFIAGPRQVGKTTLGRHLLHEVGCDALYFNWDVDSDRRALVRDPSSFFAARVPVGVVRPRVLLDEIHKYPRWKRFLKGLFDERRDELELLVTGSGRLDVYQRGGDSLLGRYELQHLHPFTTGELLAGKGREPPTPGDFVETLERGSTRGGAEEALSLIERLTGFPEPLFGGKEARLRRWRRARRDLVVREDLRDLTRVRELGLVESLVLLLPDRIGSPLSLNALAVELGVAFNTVKLWIDVLARLYFLFEVRPFAGRLARTLRREAKVYLFDPTEIVDEGARFENVVALHLAKLCDAWTDRGDGEFSLHYVRDKEKREVDFLITASRRPFLLVEAKLADATASPSLRYFGERLRPSHGMVQVVRRLARPRVEHGLRVVSAAHFLGYA